ncbi:ABC transporter ATP-binding protein [Zhihengliuella halotolerans]|uniref:ABC-2 type transport system ATP-binding protein n=1 Tax=Zhihengliuella halotolerans TaxID=370736 RepID=A0A4V2GAB0_9MICC|nr:ABC transporter ATP-binding protein [Zhihengliuella halotolerans]RZU63556.1 ABC-2 type transport system ATP-binding protein [Zhihengliuella halotolerans]
MEPVIEVENLTKNFGKVRALDGLDLSVAPGEVHGFLGPNGAGKSTTIRVLLGLLRADAGVTRLFGDDPWAHAVELHRRLAYVPGDVTLWPKLTGGEAVDLLGGLRGGLNAARRAELLDRFDLDPTRKGRTYSKGNRQKVALVAALAADVDLLVLDEPTSGLDPLMELVFQETVREAVADGKTVLLSSHILAEVEALCSRVTIIRDGATVQTGSLAELRRLTRSNVILDADVTAEELGRLDVVHAITTDAERLHFSVDDGGMGAVLSVLAGREVRSLTATPPSLEELFVHHYDAAAGRNDVAGAGRDGDSVRKAAHRA